MTAPLERVRSAVQWAADADHEIVAAIDEARAQGETWADISAAMGSDNRQYAQTWRRRKQ